MLRLQWCGQRREENRIISLIIHKINFSIFYLIIIVLIKSGSNNESFWSFLL